MKKIIYCSSLLFATLSITLSSCSNDSSTKDSNKNSSTNQNTTNNGTNANSNDPSQTAISQPWADADKTKFVEDCRKAAHQDYKNRGAEIDENMIKELCVCSGSKLEAMYSYEQLNNMEATKIKELGLEVTTECAKQLIKNP